MPLNKIPFLTIFFFQFSTLYGDLEIFNWDINTQYEVGNFVSNVSVDSEDTWRVDSRPPIGTPVTNSEYFTALSSEGTNLSTLYPNIGSTKPDDLSDAEKNSIPTSANSSILSKTSSVCFLVNPKMDALRYTFSLPVKSLLKPEPNSSKAASFPFVCTLPELGCKVLAIICSNVLFPEPFSPKIPTDSPFLILKEILLSA